MTFHIEILPETQRTVLSSIGPLAEEIGFYLAGGTAVALQLGHRQSVDFDWFTDKSIESPLALAKAFERRGLPFVRLNLGQSTHSTWHPSTIWPA